MKLTLREFAEALGVSPVTAGRWEKLKVPNLHQSSRDKLLALAGRHVNTDTA